MINEVAKKIDIIIEQSIHMKNKMKVSSSTFHFLVPTLIRQELFRLNNGLPLTNSMVAELKDSLYFITKDQKTHAELNQVLRDIENKNHNSFKTCKLDLSLYTIFIQTIYQVERKELFEAEETLNLFNLVLNMNEVILSKGDLFSDYFYQEFKRFLK